MTERPRVLFVGRARYSLPLPAWLAKKWDAVEQELDYRVLGAATADSGPSDDRFRLARPRGRAGSTVLLFYLRLPFRRATRDPAASGRRRSSRPTRFVGAAALAGRRARRAGACR